MAKLRGRVLKALAVAGIGALSVQAANATPVLGFQLYQDGGATPIASSTGVSGGYLASPANTDPLFSVLTMSATGVPIIPSPDLSTITTSITSAAGFTGTHSLTLYITQSGLTAPTGAFNFADTINLNNLVGGGITSSAKIYVDPNNGLFAAGTGASATLLGSLAGTPFSNPSNAQTTSANVGTGPYSETEILTATFTGAGQTLSTSLQLVAVPEPSALALLALPAGLIGLMTVRRRRSDAAV